MAEIEIGIGKSGRRAYGFDDIAIVPSRRTRDPEDVDITWEIDAFRFDLPLMASAMDGVVTPATAIEIGRLGGLGVLNLEGLWTRYEDPDAVLDEIAELPAEKATLRMQELYQEPIKPELVEPAHPRDQGRRRHRLRLGHPAAHREPDLRDPRRRARHPGHPGHGRLGRARVQARSSRSTSRSSSASSPSRSSSAAVPATRRRCTSCAPAPPASSSVSVPATPAPPAACSASACRRPPPSPMPGPLACATSTRPASTSTSSPTAAWRTGGDIAKAIVCGADAVMIGSPLAAADEAPGRGYHWGMATFHPTLPRGARVQTGTRGTLEEILLGPARENDGRAQPVRWPAHLDGHRAATRRSRSSRRPRSWSRRRCRPRARTSRRPRASGWAERVRRVPPS